MRHISPKGLLMIQQFEGFSPKLYACPAGYLTIGYGHVVQSDETFVRSIDKLQAYELLRTDVQTAEKAVLRLISVPLTNGQFDALVSFVFNLGAGALQRSTLRRKVNRQEHADVPAEFQRWVYVGYKKSKGLIKRRLIEASAYAGMLL